MAVVRDRVQGQSVETLWRVDEGPEGSGQALSSLENKWGVNGIKSEMGHRVKSQGHPGTGLGPGDS